MSQPILIIDQGNTDTVFAWHDGQDWLPSWRMRSDRGAATEALRQQLLRSLRDRSLKVNQLRGIVFSSVVPELSETWRELLAETGIEVLKVGPSLYDRLPLGILSPEEIGTDLVANALAAYERFGSACIVVDFGTALTFTALDSQGVIQGVAIAPGLKTAVKALFLNAAQLPEVPLELPQSALGKNTSHALQAGILMGYVSLVRGLLKQIKSELKGSVKVAATGGLVSVLEPLHKDFDHVDPRLTLEGLLSIGRRVWGMGSLEV
jgi:type III pantothenate kinase